MVGAGPVVAQGFRHVAAQENAPGAFDAGQEGEGLVHADFQVLGGNQVGDFDALLQIVGHDDFSVIVDGGAGDFLPGQALQLFFDFRLHLICKLRAVGH